MNKLSIVFIGTGAIGGSLLENLAENENFVVKMVITQVDKPAGRKMKLTPSPIKLVADELGIPVFQPESINSEESLEKIRALAPDMIVLMAYGQILKKELLNIPKYGCINVHASLLPKHRGASPIQQSLLERDEIAGISIMQMVEKMDAGPVFKRFELSISPSDNAISLSERLANLTGHKAPDVLTMIAEHGLEAIPQNEDKATYCTKIKKSDGQIDWLEDGRSILAKICAYAGWPGTFTFWDGKRLKILSAHYDDLDDKPGCVFEKDHLIMVGAGKGSIVLDRLQLEGRSPQSVSMFIKGYSNFINSKLGE